MALRTRLQSERLRHAYAASYNENPVVSERTEVEVGLHTSEADVVKWLVS